ncbi:MAG: alanine racemase [Nocardioidaceae bacterium]|nr:alanine racemase [Nocardioidaceae bacterium]
MSLPSFSDNVSRATLRAEALIDLDAISANVSRLKAHVQGRDVLAVVKADGYGHGIIQSARAARAGGASWLGVALIDEALHLREAGDTGPILSWLAVPGSPYAEAIAAGVELAAYSASQLDEIASAARQVGRRAGIHLKLDSGLGRGGATPDEWGHLVKGAAAAQESGAIEVTGVFSHLACADEPEHPSVKAQTIEFEAGVGQAVEVGLEPSHLHLANSAATLALPDTWLTMVRLGISLYGVSPFADGQSPVPLEPAMTLVARLALVKRVPTGHGISYGHTYTTTRASTLGLVPVGYADGIPRHASGRGEVFVRGQRFRIAGRVCMDQFVIDLGDAEAAAGDPVVIFGDPRRGEPSAHDWAVAADTIGYEIVTRIGPRVPRSYAGAVA